MTVRIQSNLIYNAPIQLSLPKENLMKRVCDNVWEAVYTKPQLRLLRKKKKADRKSGPLRYKPVMWQPALVRLF